MRRGTLVSILLGSVLGCGAPAPSGVPTSAAPLESEVLVGPTAPSAQASEPGLGALPPLYAPLFESGRRLVFHVWTESSRHDPDDKAAEKDGTVTVEGEGRVTCTVKAGVQRAGARVALLDCGESGDESFAVGTYGVTPAGTYIATARGLFRFQVDEKIPGDLSSLRPLLASSPRAEKEHKKETDGEWSREVAGHDDGTWCAIDDSMFGDASHSEACFKPGRGLVRLVGGSDGGSTHYATFELMNAE